MNTYTPVALGDPLPKPVKGELFLFREHPKGWWLKVNVRWTKFSTNKEKSFAITGDTYSRGCGCIHDEIVEVFPELAPLIKWHLMGPSGPMHYLANAIYLAGDGNKGKQRVGRDGPMWRCTNPVERYRLHRGEKPADEVITLAWEPVLEDGKEHELAAARRAAMWPEATDEQLLLPEPELKALLDARLPALVAAFRADIEAFGFEF